MQLPSDEQRKFFEQAASQYQSDLRSDTAAQAYLMGRGIGPEVAATFRLGVLRNPLVGHEQYRGRLAIPYLTPSGVVTFSFRCIRQHEGDCDGHPKYKAPEGMDRTLYNVLDFKKDAEAIYLCEGELDTLTLSSCGFPAVGIPGVSNWKKWFTTCFEDYPQIFVLADGDDPGYKLGAFLSREVKSRTIRMPRGEDVNSIYVKGGADAVQRWLAGATAS